MRVALTVLLLLLLMVLLSSLSALSPIKLFKPDLCVPIIIFSCTFVDPAISFFLSIASGLLEEALSSAPSGSMLFTKISLFLAILFVQKRIYVATQEGFLLLSALSPSFQVMLFFLLSAISLGETKNLSHFLFCLIPDTAATALVSYLLLPLLKRLLSARTVGI